MATYTKLRTLPQWKKKYPSDNGLFDSAARVDLNKIQSGLAKEEALIQYFPLKDALSIICVTRDDIATATVSIPYARLAELIRDDFNYRQIELFGHAKNMGPSEEKTAYKNCLEVMSRLYQLLIKPVEKAVADKRKLIIVTSKYLSYVPYSALVESFDAQGEPRFLIQDKTISYLRLSFFKNYLKARKSGPALNRAGLLVVGDPRHEKLITLLPPLETAAKEAQSVADYAIELNLPKPILLTAARATEDNWRNSAANNAFSVFYFATHGVPFAETLNFERKIRSSVDKWKMKKKQAAKRNDKETVTNYDRKISRYQPVVDFLDSTFSTKSPLNGFLYLAYSGHERNDGVLTLKEILEMPESYFREARLAVLSACNTAVTYSPQISKKLRAELESQKVNSELVKSGWTPGVDQISLTDTFMKRNFTSVLGTLWFADDAAAGYVSSNFFKGLTKFSPSESLRRAQLSYLKSNPLPKGYTATYKHPFFWAVAAIFGE